MKTVNVQATQVRKGDLIHGLDRRVMKVLDVGVDQRDGVVRLYIDKTGYPILVDKKKLLKVSGRRWQWLL